MEEQRLRYQWLLEEEHYSQWYSSIQMYFANHLQLEVSEHLSLLWYPFLCTVVINHGQFVKTGMKNYESKIKVSSSPSRSSKIWQLKKIGAVRAFVELDFFAFVVKDDGTFDDRAHGESCPC